MLVKIEGFITYTKYEWQAKPTIGFQTYKPHTGSETYIIHPHDFEVEVDEDWDPVNAKLKDLYIQRKEEEDRHAVKMKGIEDEIANLLALPAPAR